VITPQDCAPTRAERIKNRIAILSYSINFILPGLKDSLVSSVKVIRYSKSINSSVSIGVVNSMQ